MGLTVRLYWCTLFIVVRHRNPYKSVIKGRLRWSLVQSLLVLLISFWLFSYPLLVIYLFIFDSELLQFFILLSHKVSIYDTVISLRHWKKLPLLTPLVHVFLCNWQKYNYYHHNHTLRLGQRIHYTVFTY